MRIKSTNVTIKDIMNAGRGFGYGRNQKIVMEFMDSGMDIAEVVLDKDIIAHRKTQTLNKTIKRIRLTNVRAMTHNGVTYLVRLDKVNKV